MEASSTRDQAEAAFLSGYDLSRFPQPSVTVDVALITATEGALYTVTVQRKEHPFTGWQALPGGFVRLDESPDDTAVRVLAEKAGLQGVFLEQLYTFGAPRRDPRGRVITVAHYALVNPERFRAAAQGDGDIEMMRIVVPWKGETGGAVKLSDRNGVTIPVAFDHAEILGMAVKRLRGKLEYTPIGFQLLPKRFTLLELQRIHEIVLGRRINKNAFRRKMIASGMLKATGELQDGVEHRPAELYRFARRSAT